MVSRETIDTVLAPFLLHEKQCDQLFHYAKMLLEENQHMNLTAITDPIEVCEKHFADSLLLRPFLKESATVVDVGTGAGFPGLVLAIAEPEKKITLVESLHKRTKFLAMVRDALELKNVEIVTARAEDAGRDSLLRENFDLACARAVAPLSILLEYLSPFVRPGGRIVAMKSLQVKDELDCGRKAARKLGLSDLQIEICPSFFAETRNVVVLKKEHALDEKFPRRAGIPKKRPLC